MVAKTLLSPEETTCLMELLESNSTRGNILEIGSYSCDGSSVVFAEHVRENGGSLYMADLFCIDGFEERCQALVEGLDAHILKGFSAELARGCDTTFDFMFIDGDHGFPRFLANGHQSGVACDITAWHNALNVGGIMAFHDYTGDESTFGQIKYLPIEYAVDSLCAAPLYEFAGKAGRVIAFRKLRHGELIHTHKPKKAPVEYRDKWERLDRIPGSSGCISLFGTPVACERVATSIRQAIPDASIAYCPLEQGSAGVCGCSSVDQETMFASGDLVITAGTAPEEERIMDILADTPVMGDKRHISFMEWFGWFFLGRYGYL